MNGTNLSPSRAIATAIALAAAAPVLAGGLDSPLELSLLDGTNGFTLRGIAAGDESGGPAAGAGDMNGDGIHDLVIGAAAATRDGNIEIGELYVVFGTDAGFTETIDLSSLNGANGFTVRGDAAGDELGGRIAWAGDVNGDGFDDIIAGAEGVDEGLAVDTGAAYVIYGSDQPFDPLFSVAALNGTNGFKIRGVDSDDECGSSVNTAGDVNGDGIADMIIGAQGGNAAGPDTGEAYIVYGNDQGFDSIFLLSSLDGTNGVLLEGVDLEDECGRSVDTAGDMNGDGYSDVIIGASLGDPNGNMDAGEAYVVFGGPALPRVVLLGMLNGTNGFTINGEAPLDETGVNVASVGDVNGDGLGDVVVGSNHHNANGLGSGASYVVLGNDQESFPDSMNLSALDGTDGFVLNGASAGDGAGRVGGGADLNGDGLSEILVGAPSASPNAIAGAGQAYAVFGSDTGFTSATELALLDGTDGLIMNGVAAGDGAGRSVGWAGDVNGDGVTDIVVGAKHADPGGLMSAGETYVIFGVSGGGTPCPGDTNDDGEVDVSDLVNIIVAWGSADPSADLNDDGVVDVQDLVTLITNWGTCP